MNDIRTILSFYQEIGVDEVIGAEPLDRFAVVAEKLARKQAAAAAAPHHPATNPPPPDGQQQWDRSTPTPALPPKDGTQRHEPAQAQQSATRPPAQAAIEAARLANACQSLEELEQALSGFTGCSLKQTANHTVFADGNPAADVMVLGDAPGSDDDRLGYPFAGARGQFLDRMLASIGLFRKLPPAEEGGTPAPGNVYLGNLVFWRPPGNRKPSEGEVNICRPFLLRHIELAAPKLVILSGSVVTAAVLKNPGNMLRARGKWHDLALPNGRAIPAMPLYGPDILLQKPLLKREAWQDLQTLRARMLADGLVIADPRFVVNGPVS